MEEKHIFAPSRKKEILQKLSQLKENFRQSAQKVAPKPPAPQPPKEIFVTNKPKISPETGEKILTYTLVFAVVSILLMGIILGLSNKPRQKNYQPVIPTLLPTRAVSPTQVSVQYKTYTDNDLHFSFKYPADWNLRENPPKVTNPANTIIVSVSLYDPRLVGATYCNANPEVKPRCETFKQSDITFGIDWSESNTGPFSATSTSKDGTVGVSLVMETNPDKPIILKTNENQELFRTFISDFTFTI